MQFSVHIILHEYAVPTYLEVCFGSCLIRDSKIFHIWFLFVLRLALCLSRRHVHKLVLPGQQDGKWFGLNWKSVPDTLHGYDMRERSTEHICNLNIPYFCFYFLQEHKLQTCHRSPVPNWYKNPKFSTVLTIFPSWNVSGYLESRCISNAVNFLQA